MRTSLLASSLRSFPAAETWRRAKAVLHALGVARVTEITRLDRLGLPVHTSVRPRGLRLRAHAGKGLREEDSRIGAAMEAIEFAVMELDARQEPEAPLSFEAMARSWPQGLDLADFAPAHGAGFDPAEPRASLSVECLGSRRRLWLPSALFRPPFGADRSDPLFGWSTNGLASGNTLEEATLHALLEVLERDARAMNAARDDTRRVPNEELPAPLGPMAAGWRKLGVELIVREFPNDFGLPCFGAWLHEPASVEVGLAMGAGLHLSREIALVRAVSEAAQSRLTTLHGAREDVTRFFSASGPGSPPDEAAAQARLLAALRDDTRAVSYASVAHHPVRTPVAALARMLARLRARGFPWVLRRRLDTADALLARAGLHVVKVVVPRCESVEHGSRRVGPRLQARILGLG